MKPSIQTLKATRDQAQAEFERMEAAARMIRAELTAAERKARAARKAFEAARLAWVDAVEGNP
ncbi:MULTISPECIES: hypothetical protein [unclassified Thiocapsa]|uniref:hypothetical protein n=1 Tax=unclassified Thiocapsa TaxID=2641286 RepID=UPI0035AF5F74